MGSSFKFGLNEFWCHVHVHAMAMGCPRHWWWAAWALAVSAFARDHETLRAALAEARDGRRRHRDTYGVYVQSDSRTPRVPAARRNESWWWASGALASRQARRHGDAYAHYVVPASGCVAHDGLTELTAPWCKVRAMVAAMDAHPRAAVFMYLDSDAAVSDAFANASLAEIAAFAAARTPGFGDGTRPVLLSRDGHGHWCLVLWERRGELPPWDACLNAGVVLWKRDAAGRARAFLEAWWRAGPSCCDHFPNAQRVWPWEQVGLQYAYAAHAAVAAAVPDYAAAGLPHARHLVWPPKVRKTECPRPWCLAHVPGACCVVDHYCAGRRDKYALVARALGDAALMGALRPVATAPLPLVDRRVNASLTYAGRAARTGMISPAWATALPATPP